MGLRRVRIYIFVKSQSPSFSDTEIVEEPCHGATKTTNDAIKLLTGRIRSRFTPEAFGLRFGYF
jgi:hypothetical protein